jgi:predicted nucleotidyltransferase
MASVSNLVSDNLDVVGNLCRQHHVQSLELFGSAANGRFNVATSDLDFLVQFQPLAPADRADAYFGLLAALQDLFDRRIDLVEVEAINNPYLREIVDQQRTVVYAA